MYTGIDIDRLGRNRDACGDVSAYADIFGNVSRDISGDLYTRYVYKSPDLSLETFPNISAYADSSPQASRLLPNLSISIPVCI